VRPQTFTPREFFMRTVWRWRSETVLVVATAPLPAPPNSKYTRATSYLLWVFEQLPEAIEQTRVTLVQTVNMGGIIPPSAVTKGAIKQLSMLSAFRKKYDRSKNVDARRRQEFRETFRRDRGASYTSKEEAILAQGMDLFKVTAAHTHLLSAPPLTPPPKTFEEQPGKKLKMTSPATRARISFKPGVTHAYGWAAVVVRAPPDELLAWQWDLKSRCGAREDDVEKSVDEDGLHNVLTFVEKKPVGPIRGRAFLSRCIWRASADGTYIFVSSPEESERRPIDKEMERNVVYVPPPPKDERAIPSCSLPPLTHSPPHPPPQAWKVPVRYEAEEDGDRHRRSHVHRVRDPPRRGRQNPALGFPASAWGVARSRDGNPGVLSVPP
jgi:hypothetical protein